MEQRRRCAWLGFEEDERKLVWAKRGAASSRCPKSVITAQSQAWLEVFAAWQTTGSGLAEMSAKDLDALAWLKREWERAKHDER